MPVGFCLPGKGSCLENFGLKFRLAPQESALTLTFGEDILGTSWNLPGGGERRGEDSDDTHTLCSLRPHLSPEVPHKSEQRVLLCERPIRMPQQGLFWLTALNSNEVIHVMWTRIQWWFHMGVIKYMCVRSFLVNNNSNSGCVVQPTLPFSHLHVGSRMPQHTHTHTHTIVHPSLHLP